MVWITCKDYKKKLYALHEYVTYVIYYITVEENYKM
jgi:hypothetical protein